MRLLVGGLAAAGGFAVAAIGWLAYAAAGPAGIAGLAAALLGVAAVVARLRIARPQPLPVGEGPVRVSAVVEDFPAYRKIASDLHWSASSRHYFDRVVRPQLWEVLRANAESRHGPAAARDVAWLRDRVGADLWPLVDPDHPSWTDQGGSRAAGPDAVTLDRLLTRIEGI